MNTRRLPLGLLAGLLVFVSLACLGSGVTQKTPTPPPPPTEAAQPTLPPPPTETTHPTLAPPTAASGLGIIQSVTMASGITGDSFKPVGPTINFVDPPVVHVVVSTQDAPAKTTVRVDWFLGSAGKVPPDSNLGTYEITTDGSRNLDFSFKPDAHMTHGAYYVEVYLDGHFFLRVNFYVAAQ
jgi:hypothetical protein